MAGDASLTAQEVADIIMAWMVAYIPSSTKTFSPKNPWFDRRCSEAINTRDRAFRSKVHPLILPIQTLKWPEISAN